MIKVTAVVTNRNDWTKAEWLMHYREVHGPLVASVPSFVQYAKRYAQNYVINDADTRRFPEYFSDATGVTELWYDNPQALVRSHEDAEYLRVIRPDEERFRNVATRNWIVGHPQPVYDARVFEGDKALAYLPRIKGFVFVEAAGELEISTFQRSWLAFRSSSVPLSAHFKQRVRKYEQVRKMEDPIGRVSSSHQVIEEFWFDNREDAIEFWFAEREVLRMVSRPSHIVDRTRILFAENHTVYGSPI